MKGARLLFLLPRCRLSYQKIMQIESNTKFAKIRIANLKPIHFYCRDAAYLIKR